MQQYRSKPSSGSQDEPFDMQPQHLIADRRLSRTALDLFAVLRRFARFQGGVCRADNRRLAREMGLKERCIRLRLEELENLGMIVRCMDATGRIRLKIEILRSDPTLRLIDDIKIYE
jgi:hypothetical protein